ncbi:MAG: methionine aminotransferase [Chitinophagaceae bacterium]|nr:methionine aminotransferase [Chitinophagaceae bacterium]
MEISSRLPGVSTTIFTTMSALAAEFHAVNLGQGFPDFPMNDELIRLVHQAMKDGFNQYAPMAGYLPLREAIAEKIFNLYKNPVHPETEITITPGGTYAIYSAITSLIREGDEVIVPEPAYDSYIPNIEINGGVAVTIPLRFPDYKIDWRAVKNAISPKTKAIILNSPHNPTGSILKNEDIEELRTLVRDSSIFIISDEVYEHLIFDDLPHLSMLRFPDLYQRSFVCFSFGKVYNCTGWKLGYCVAPPKLTAEFRKVHQFNCFSCFTPAQVALSIFLKNKDAYLQLSALMQEKRDFFIRIMKDTRFRLLPSYGSYFICSSYDNISDEDDKTFAIRMTKEAGVASIPLSAFYRSGKDDKMIRFCFCKKEETLLKAAERLIKM